MKKLIYILAIGLAIASCNNPDQNTATGNRVDSLNTGDTSAVNDGPGLENTGGTGTGTADSTKNQVKPDSSHH